MAGLGERFRDFTAGADVGDHAPGVVLYDAGGTAVGASGALVTKDLSAVAIGSIATVWTPASGKKVRLLGGTLSVSAAVNVLFEDNAAGAGAFLWRTPKLAVDTPYTFTVGAGGKVLAAANNVLKATSSAAANVTGTLYGTEE
jgi:hypothetical protein